MGERDQMELCHSVAAERLATVLKTFSPSDVVLAASSPHPLVDPAPKRPKIRFSWHCSAFCHDRLQLKNFWSLVILLYLDGSPVVCFNAVNAARPIGSRGNIIQVSKHVGAAGARSIDLGGVVQALVRQLLAANGRSNGRGKMDVALIWLVHLRLVGEKDLRLWAVENFGETRFSWHSLLLYVYIYRRYK